MAALRGWWRIAPAASGDHLLRSGYALMLSTLASSALGVGYWVLAAREYPTAALGEGSAAISAMLMLSSFAQLNLFYALTRFIPRAGAATGRLIGYCYAASASLALLLGTAFVFVAPRVSSNLSFLLPGAAAAGFVLAVALWGIFALQDGVLTALRRAPWVPVENTLFGLVKLGLLMGFAGVFVSGGIFTSWTISVLLAVIPMNILIYRRLLRGSSLGATSNSAFSFRGVARFAAIDYISALFLQSYTTALPLLIVATIGAEANANFYVAYAVIAAVDLLAVNMTTSLVVESSHDADRLAEYTRRVVRRSVQLLLPVILLLELGAPYLLQAFGDEYAEGSTTLLRLLALASLPRLVNTVYMGAMRAERRVGRVVLVQAGISVVVVSLSLVLVSPLNVDGVGMAWLCGHTLVALALIPWLRRTLRPALGAV